MLQGLIRWRKQQDQQGVTGLFRDGTPQATVEIEIGDQTKSATVTGNGPVDAAYKAINQIANVDVTLMEYLVQAIHGGSDDFGKVHVQILYHDNVYYGFGTDTDIIQASAQAYLDAINKI